MANVNLDMTKVSLGKAIAARIHAQTGAPPRMQPARRASNRQPHGLRLIGAPE
jgi:hypothetical protein